MKSSDTVTSLKGSFWIGVKLFSKYLIQLVITFFLARILAPENFGEIAAIQIIIGIADLFWQLGIGPALVRKKDVSLIDIETASSINIIMGVLLFLIINITANFLSSSIQISSTLMLRAYSLVFIFHSLGATSMALAQKRGKFKNISIITIISMFTYGIVTIILGFANFGTWAIIIGTIFQSIITASLYQILIPIKPSFRINKHAFNEMIFFGGGFTLSRVFAYMANQADYFMINRTMNKEKLGLYSKAYQILLTPVSVIGETIDFVLFPLLSNTQDDLIKLKRIFLNVTFLVLTTSIPITITMYFYSYDIILLLLGDKWTAAVEILKALIIGYYFRTAVKVNDSVLRALGLVYQRASLHFLNILFVGIAAYFGSKNGLIRIAEYVSLTFVINYFLVTLLVLFKLKVKPIQFIQIHIVPIFIFVVVVGFSLLTYIDFTHIYFLRIGISFCLNSLFTVLLLGLIFIVFKDNDQMKFLKSLIFNVIHIIRGGSNEKK